jgi:hypothetical protein
VILSKNNKTIEVYFYEWLIRFKLTDNWLQFIW